jgi:ATP-binding cassette, subfamily B, bacterial
LLARCNVGAIMPADPPKPSTRLRVVQRVGQLAREVWATGRPLCLAPLICRLISSVLPVALLGITGLLVDAINHAQKTGDGLRRVWLLLLAEVAVVLFTDLQSRFSSYCDLVLNNRFTLRMNLRLISNCNQLDLEFFENSQFQDRLERARTQAGAQVGLLHTLLDIGQQAIGLVAMIASSFFVAPFLVVVQLVGVVPIVFAEGYFARRRYHLHRERTAIRRMLEYLLLLGTSAVSAKEIKLFDVGRLIWDRYAGLSEKYNDQDAQLSARQSVIGALLVAGGSAIYYASYGVLIFRTAHGLLSLGRLVFLAGVLKSSKDQLSSLFWGFSRTSDQLMYLNDVFEFFDEKPTVRSGRPYACVPAPIRKGVEFRNVSFSYGGSCEPALSNVSFRIEPGERVALVGENGAGKTTVIKLLTRLYDPTAGQILIDGIDLREFDPGELRRAITAIFQDFVRYDFSAEENIAFGDLGALGNRGRVTMAAEQAQAAALIGQLPKGYSQILGKRFEDGVDLSGGQWQKVALARACIRDAQVVILDEPTSAIDPRAEAMLFRNFTEMVSGKMAIVISHRFSTVRIADRILVLEKGRISEQGSHEELVRAGGEYAELFELQAAGYR